MISLREIPPEGLRRSFDLGGEIAARAFEGTEVDPQQSTVAADLVLQKSGDEVLARGRLSGELTAVCSRCVGPAKVAVDAPVEMLFLPHGGGEPEGADDELDELDELDVVHYTDDQIDLGEPLREELVLAIPIAPLCRESCKGLCPRCGKDLNEGPCDCPEEPRDDRWSALRDLQTRRASEDRAAAKPRLATPEPGAAATREGRFPRPSQAGSARPERASDPKKTLKT